MLKFQDGADIKVGNVIVVIYGAPNVGKTSLVLTAANPLLIDFDGGAYRAGNKSGKSVVTAKSWSDVAAMSAEDLEKFDTLIIDTVGTCLDSLVNDIMSGNPKMRSQSGHANPSGLRSIERAVQVVAGYDSQLWG